MHVFIHPHLTLTGSPGGQGSKHNSSTAHKRGSYLGVQVTLSGLCAAPRSLVLQQLGGLLLHQGVELLGSGGPLGVLGGLLLHEAGERVGGADVGA